MSTSTSTSAPPPPLDDQTVSNPLECPPLKWGLIGCGRISHDFTQALKLLPTAEVVACSARSIDSAKAFADKHGIDKYCKFLSYYVDCCHCMCFFNFGLVIVIEKIRISSIIGDLLIP